MQAVDERATGLDTQLSSPMTPSSFFGSEHESDNESLATTAPDTVMAEQVTSHVVKEAQSVGHAAPIGDSASTTSTLAANGELPSGPTPTDNDPSDPLSDAATATSSAPAVQEPYLNGDSEHAVADASGGSDTDISRPGSVDPAKQETGHVRTNSTLKKPAAFKSVSVTKSFLAKSAVSTPAARTGDKALAVAPAAASAVLAVKPRLVAKLGTGNAPRALGKVNGAGTGPDASKVWNKNQPVPPAPPKQFTDEELKQQYGIHLATRLQADEAGKEAKWADIDDDEDDWAPDTVQWMDGTKSSGAAAENEPPPAEEPKTILKAPEAPLETAKPPPPTATIAPKPTVTGGTKTILKPGAHAQPATGKSSLVLKGQPEKPTLVTKTSSSDKKSPWAVLPPVEKVPPVQINAPTQQPPAQRYSQRDSYGYDPMPTLPAKEIAPDDFNRTRRDERGSRPELFNSQSGRYEPVSEMRRDSRRDSSFRQQPAVLQRPQDGGPAEPSAAFQTSRSGGDMPTWGGRRRNSSNVSSGNGRRMSFDKRGPDMPNDPLTAERRDSHPVNGIDSPDVGAAVQPHPSQTASPNVANVHPTSPYDSVASSGAQDLPTPITAAPVEDPVEVQKRLMAEKIERARLKKQQQREAELKEEAEKKERLAKRMAAMGPPAEPKSKVKVHSPAPAPERSPQKDKAVPATVQSPPKPPLLSTDGEVAQYGMMKVHQPHPVKKSTPVEPTATAKPTTSAEPASTPSLPVAQTEGQTKVAPPPVQQAAPLFDAFTVRDGEPRKPAEQLQSSVGQSEASLPAGPKPHATWQPAASQPQARGWTSQVWGPPQTKARALGNGTFGSNYDRNQARAGSQQQLPTQPQSATTTPAHVNLATEPSRTQPVTLPPTTQPMYSQVRPLAAQPVAPARQPPVLPPSAKGWGNFEAHIKQDDKSMKAKARQDMERLGGETFRPEIRETYKDQRGQAQSTLHDKVAGNLDLPSNGAKKDGNIKAVHDGPSSQQTLTQGPPVQHAPGARASRFFPRSADVVTQSATTVSDKAYSPPPPPETASHPAFMGNPSHPLVRLPKPSPVVRLPPSAIGSAAQDEAPVSMPPRGNPGLGARPLAMNPEWQARFNQLLAKPGSSSAQATASRPTAAAPAMTPSKPGSLAVAVSTKAALDVRGAVGSATVSLPNAPVKGFFANNRGREAVTRKGTEVLFEDREFGSLPTVRLSKVPHLAAKETVVNPPVDDHQLVRFKKMENPFTTRRLEAFDIEKGVQKIDVVIRLSNMSASITKSMPRGRRGAKGYTQFNNKQKRASVPNGPPSGGNRDRLRKMPQPQGERPNNSSRPTTTTTWTNSSRPDPNHPAHGKTSWAKLAAGSAH